MGGDLNEKVSQFNLTIDVRGKRVEEAMEQVEKYLDEALLLSMKEITSCMARAMGFAQSNPRIVEQTKPHHFEDAPAESGGHGITRVSL